MVQSDAPTLVAMPTVPSAHEIGPGQPGSATTAFAAARSIFWFVTGPMPPGNKPSMITSRFTFCVMSFEPPGPCSRPARLV